ncbi:phosphate acyltransferase PlsX [Aliiglaciecola lipolytica]|uniref:Phosphate acyltransferase n=1 Tax=Aliiglaciecola lipolytica E3 TaxID=1127673 RepID=K6XT61_9ALTE|nr:phosphate acyltransferase PlsX [Aliiglaciecola lipolytica]GAC14851.1 glycerol-3-phosphate acyltransferase PlsX [Aliiglaciecola lipolytica E3]
MTFSRLTIALDIMGGDNGPHVTLPAALKALQENPQLYFILCGDEKIISQFMSPQKSAIRDRIEIQHCSDHVAMDERPSSALRNKKDSSMRRALERVENGDADACVSAGNTGALLAIAYHVLKTLPGIDRPALVSALPTDDHHKLFLLDLGANVNCDSETLFQYAVMGSVLAEEVAGIENPRVALLNVGEEQIKGNDQVKFTAQLLQDAPGINYTGFVEGNDIFTNCADVVVTDGFVGNIALKACEGLATLVLEESKRVSQENWWTKLLAKIALPLLRKIYRRVNPDQYNGASLIGLRGIVVKSHGNASSDAFLFAIKEAEQEIQRQVPKKIKDKIESVLMERS